MELTLPSSVKLSITLGRKQRRAVERDILQYLPPDSALVRVIWDQRDLYMKTFSILMTLEESMEKLVCIVQLSSLN